MKPDNTTAGMIMHCSFYYSAILPEILPGISDTNIFMLLSLRNTCQVDITCFFAQTGKENTRMWMNIVIYFVNGEKVMQKQGFFHLQASKSVLSNIVEVFMHF